MSAPTEQDATLKTEVEVGRRHTPAFAWPTVALSLGLFAVFAAGFGYELLILCFLPWWIGQSVMLTFVTWIPHHDHSEIGRYRDTRIPLWPAPASLARIEGLLLEGIRRAR